MYRKALAVLMSAALTSAALVVLTAAPAAAASCHAGTPSDFNGDGIADAVIAEPGDGGGRVHILYGTRSGLTATASGTALANQLIISPEETFGGFGDAMATGDFNGDGCTDLAVDDRETTINGALDAGTVRIYLGSPTGVGLLKASITRATFGETPGQNNLFGMALAAGDFTGDGVADLVIGSPQEASHAGEIYILAGSKTDSFTTGKHFKQGDGIVPGSSETNDNFGFSLAVGDFDGDHHTDLAVGDPGENSSAGTVVILRGSGSSSMLTTTGHQTWSQNSSGIPGTSEAGDRFGVSLAVGDFNGDKHPDLAVGVPNEADGSVVNGGLVNVIYGSSTGLKSTGAQAWTQNSTGVAGTANSGDLFGYSLAAGDFNGGGKTDLAIGVPQEGLGSAGMAGSVNVLVGAAKGLSASGSSQWNQSSAGIAGTAEEGDFWGWSLAALPIRSATRDDLLVGVPFEDTGSAFNNGAAE
ncbi:MAG TPA: FG-GAP and VCBS repeat-containing protein, partial [Micromonosporaceae bacterium]